MLLALHADARGQPAGMDLDGLIHGAVRLERLGDAPVPRRLSAAQEALLAGDPVWPRCARGCSGVQLRLRTDATWVDLRLRVWGDTRPRTGLDIEVDGRWHATLRDEHQAPVIERRIFEMRDRGERTMREIRVHLPLGLEVAIEALTAEPGARVEPMPATAPRLLCLGDSITQGHAAASAAATWAAQLARLLGADLLDQGVAGHVWQPDFLAAVPEVAPRLVTVAYGVNDWSRGQGEQGRGRLDGIRSAVRDGLARLRPRIASARLAVITPLWCDFANRPVHGCTLAEVRALIAAEAAAAGALVIDGGSLLPPAPWWTADGLHPNEAGMGLIAARLHPLLEPAWSAA